MITTDLIIELIGACFTFLSVIYAIKERWISWVFAIASAIFYALIYWSAGLVVSAEIQILYFTISVYGLIRWQINPDTNQPKERIKRGDFYIHILTLAAILLGGIALVLANKNFERAELVYYDAALVSTAIVAQWLMSKKYLSCWYLWILVNIGYLPLFYIQGLWISLLLYLVLLYFTIQGTVVWHQKVNEHYSTA